MRLVLASFVTYFIFFWVWVLFSLKFHLLLLQEQPYLILIFNKKVAGGI